MNTCLHPQLVNLQEQMLAYEYSKTGSSGMEVPFTVDSLPPQMSSYSLFPEMQGGKEMSLCQVFP